MKAFLLEPDCRRASSFTLSNPGDHSGLDGSKKFPSVRRTSRKTHRIFFVWRQAGDERSICRSRQKSVNMKCSDVAGQNASIRSLLRSLTGVEFRPYHPFAFSGSAAAPGVPAAIFGVTLLPREVGRTELSTLQPRRSKARHAAIAFGASPVTGELARQIFSPP